MLYRIAIRPQSLTMGELKVPLKCVTFYAKGLDEINWWTTNYGQLAEVFHRMVQPVVADNLIAIRGHGRGDYLCR